MRSDLAAKAETLVALIRKYDGWLEGDEVIRFPSGYKRERFEAELEAGKASSHVDVWEAATIKLED